MKLKKVTYEMVVDVSPQKAWQVLAAYGNVGDFHPGVKSSSAINGSGNYATKGCERVCHLVDGKRKIMVKEKIVDILDEQYYKYDVYEWENFPLKKMYNTFGVKTNNQGKTVIYQISEYRLKPRVLTWLMAWKMKKSARDGLLGYKHFMETGEKNIDIQILRSKYKSF